MISVGSRDGIKGLGFGDEMKMEETELEEGEACYDDENFDPDVRFSYIDEKIQDILGHFQKDFEGGVSAENLGSKFGGYGSFLPTYQRSPTIVSHPRTPQKVQNYEVPRSPNNWPSKDSCQNAKVPSTVAATRPGSASVNSLTPVSIAPAVGNSSKRDLGLSSTQCTGEFTPKHKPVNKLSNPTDQKPPLKVRIKVGPHTMLAQNNAAIYSGLGLDISPSSSLEDSPSESEGLSPESHDALYASPMSILQNMTSFPVPEGFLLSPLSDHLLHLREQEKLPSDSISGVSHKCSQDGSEKLVAGSPCMMVSKKVSGQKKKKSLEKKLMEVKKKNVNDVGNKNTLLRKEINVKNPGDMELVPNTLKFPLTSKSSRNNNDQARGTGSGSDVTREVDKCMLKEEIFSSFAKVEALEPSTVHEVNNFEKQNSKTDLANSFTGDRKTSSLKGIQFEPRSEVRSKDDQGYDSYGDKFDNYKGRKDHNDGPNNCPEHKAGNKAIYQEQYGSELPHGKEQPSTGAKKKSKGGRGKDIPPPTEFPKESSRVVSSLSRKEKKKHAGNIPSKSKMEEKRLQKESDKNSESNIDLFGNEKMELAENRMNLLETPFRHAPKDSKFNVTEKEITTFSDKSKERSKGKNVENQVHAKVTPIITSSTGYGPVSDAVPETAAPLVIQDYWVCCDKCQKWRLLPYDHNPDKLPKKWLCSMICWLPGMNRCNISEEETTKAFHALYQVRVPESQNSLNTLPHGAATGVTLAGLQNVDQTHRDGDLHGVISGGRKKLKLKETEYETMHSHMDPTHFPESTKEGLQTSMKSKNLHEASHMPLESNLASVAGFQHLSKSSDIPVDKLVHKLKEKKKMLQSGGDTRHPKMRSKRGIDQDGEWKMRSISKKIKTAVLETDEEWFSDHDPVMGNRDRNSINWFKNKTTGEEVQNHSEYSQDSQYERKDKILASLKKLPDNAKVSLNVAPLDPVICDKVVIAAKKRKLKDWQESNGHCLENNNISLKDETCESERRKEKKARLSKSEKKESSSSKGGNKTDKRGRVAPIIISTSRKPVLHGMGDNASDCIMKDQQLGHRQQGNKLLQQSLDATDIVKKDFDYAQHSVAAASSCSKVSGSRKSKANFHEVKGSPVGSVSSSPLRISKPDKVMPARRKLLGKDDVTNVGFNIMVSPRKAYCEVDGSNVPYETIRMKKASSLVHRSSGVSSVLDKQDRDASGDKGKPQMETFSSIFDNSSLVNGTANDPDQLNPCFGGEDVPAEGLDNRKSSNGAQQRKSGRGSSLRSKDRHRSSKSVYGNDDLKVSSSLSEQELYQTKNLRYEAEIGSHNRSSHCEELKEEKNHFQEKCGARSKRDEKNRLSKKDSLGKSSSESRKENQLNFGKLDCPDINIGGISGKDRKSSPQKTPLQVYEGDKLSNRFFSDATDLEIAPGKGKSQLYPNSGVKQEMHSQSNRPKSGMLKESGSDILPVDASGCSGDACKASNQSENLDCQNGTRHNTLRHSISNGIVARDLGAPSPARKDSSGQAAANAFKEAKDLKHTADRMKNNGLEVESASIYFQAALKFLQGASILELCNNESAKHGEISYMIEMYSSTAKLCEFVAREYERLKDMASASLAYKCMEVAYMRIIYSRNSIVSKDRHELQAALQILPPGESPSSSASDLDNLNNQGTLDKVALAKGVSSPQMTGNHVIVARIHPNFVRLLNFAQNVNFAMEALRKSQNAFAAANADLGEAHHSEGISSVKRVIDFTFYDVDGLLRLVRLAMEAISR